MMSKTSKTAYRQVKPNNPGILSKLDICTQSLPDNSTEKRFSFKAVLWQAGIIGILFIVCLALQAWWVIHSKSVSTDPWWAQMLGMSSYNFDAGGIIAGIFGLALAPGVALLLFGLIFFWIRPIFLIGMFLVFIGLSNLLGLGLGEIVLYHQVSNGLITAESIHSGTNIVNLSYEPASIAAESWPVIIAAIIFAIFALALALTRRPNNPPSRALNNTKAAVSIGLFGIILVERGSINITLACIIVTLLLAFSWLPGEIQTARECEAKHISATWQWHAAFLISLETLLVFAMTIVTVLDI